MSTMISKTRRWAAAFLTAIAMLTATTQVARAQDHECKVVGWEVFSTNTPGGGGELKSQGLTGERTPWMISTPAPSTAGSAVTNIVVRYYCCKECRDAAIQKDKDEKKKKKEKDDKKKELPKGGTPPDVPTFDPRFYELKDGKVVPKKPRDEDQKSFENDHRHCDIPSHFECGEHFQWWVQNHEHRTEPRPLGSRLVMTGTVVSGEPVTMTAVDEKGAIIRGAVIELPNDQTAKADDQGRISFNVPAGLQTLVLRLQGSPNKHLIWATDSPHFPVPDQSFQISNPLTRSDYLTINVPPDAHVTGVLFDNKPIAPLATSHGQMVIQVPADAKPGLHSVVAVDQGDIVRAVLFDTWELKVEPPKTFVKGQAGEYKIEVVGTKAPVPLRIENRSPSVIQIEPTKGLKPVSSNGLAPIAAFEYNYVALLMLRVRALKPGDIQIAVSARPTLNRWGFAAKTN